MENRKVVVELGCNYEVIVTVFEMQDVPHVEHVWTEKPGSTTDWSFMGRVSVPYHTTHKEWVKVEERPATEEESQVFWDKFLQF